MITEDQQTNCGGRRLQITCSCVCASFRPSSEGLEPKILRVKAPKMPVLSFSRDILADGHEMHRPFYVVKVSVEQALRSEDLGLSNLILTHHGRALSYIEAT